VKEGNGGALKACPESWYGWLGNWKRQRPQAKSQILGSQPATGSFDNSSNILYPSLNDFAIS